MLGNCQHTHTHTYTHTQVTGESPPAPTRGPSVAQDEEEEEAESSEAGGGGGGGAKSQAPVSLADMMPKVDISGQIKSSLISELGDKNWKVRGEGLTQVLRNIVNFPVDVHLSIR